MGYFFVILYYGSKANDIDFKIKEKLVMLAQDCNDIKQIAMDDLVFSDSNNQIHIKGPNADKTEGLISENEEVIEKTEILE